VGFARTIAGEIKTVDVRGAKGGAEQKLRAPARPDGVFEQARMKVSEGERIADE